MTNLIEQIQNNRSTFRKDASKAVDYSILTLLVGELETVSKRDGSPITDEKVVAAARKLIKSNNETHKLKPSLKLIQENACLEQLLPQQMSEEQIRDAIKDSGAANLGEAMKALKSNPDAVYDSALAVKIAKELF